MMCSWPAFVVLSLALGVDPYRGGLLDLKRNIYTNFREIRLKSTGSQSIITVRRLENRVFARVMPYAAFCCLLTGLAWVGSMIETHGKVLHVILSGREGFDGTYHGGDHAMRQVRMATFGDVTGQAAEKALAWVLYSEPYHHKHRVKGYTMSILDVLPVTQKILKTREDIVEELRLLTDLKASLNEIFLSESLLVDMILNALRQEWDTPEVILDGKRSARPYTENPPGYVDIWDNLQENDTFKTLKDNFYPLSNVIGPSMDSFIINLPILAEFPAPMVVLAKVIIAVSSIQKWPREEWSVEFDENRKASFIVPADPMDELLPEGESERDLFTSFFESNYFRGTDDEEVPVYFE